MLFFVGFCWGWGRKVADGVVVSGRPNPIGNVTGRATWDGPKRCMKAWPRAGVSDGPLKHQLGMEMDSF